MRKSTLFFLGLFVLFSAVFAGYLYSQNPDVKARKIMRQYNLHPAEGPEILEVEIGGRFFDLVNNASRDIGLDLGGYVGSRVKVFKYLLEERNQSQWEDICAFFYVDGKWDIIGAYLSLKGYTPSITSLKNRRFFMPEGLEPENPVFSNIEKIELCGPWEENRYKNKAILTSQEEINELTEMFAGLEPRQGELRAFHKLVPLYIQRRYKGVFFTYNSLYLLFFHYKDGPVVRVCVYSKGKDVKVNMDPFPYWHYNAPEELKLCVEKYLY